MLKKFYPYEYANSVYDINYKKLYEEGYRGLIFDIDNTLVHHGDDSTPEVDKFIKEVQDIGFKTMLLSNNNEERVKRFVKNIDSLYIFDADKPNEEGYLNAIKMLEIEKDKIISIGDQIFVDVIGANKVELPNILVKYIELPNSTKKTKIGKKRYIEKVILKFYKKSKYCHRFGNILN